MLNLEGGYLGFTFNGHHSSEFGLLVVSDGDRYHQNLSSNFTDTVVSVPGKNGVYYFGTQLQAKDFDIKCVYDEMTSHMMHKVQQWLYPTATGWLVYDEKPYKKYWVKVSNVISPTFLPFDNILRIKDYTIQQEIDKGEMNINFFSFYEYGFENEEYSIPNVNINTILLQQDIDSGLIPNNYSHDGVCLPHQYLSEISNNTNFNFYIYNAGNGIAAADFYFNIPKSEISDNDPLEIFNYNDGESYIITNPSSIIEENDIDIDSVYYYRIIILGEKKEIWLDCLDNNKQKINTASINIGACYNHYFPKIYHRKPTEIMIMSQLEGEPLFYTYSYGDSNLFSSDELEEKEHYSFNELQKSWTDYIILTPKQTISINDNINPIFTFIHHEEGGIEESDLNQIVYLVCPNKFYCNKTITDFIVEYKHTYI